MSLVRSIVRLPRMFSVMDLVVLAGLGALVYGLVAVGREWTGWAGPVAQIDLSPWALPGYTMLSLFRGFAAYALSLVFTLVYGRVAAYNPRAEKVMVPLLDILQSVPVLGFLPGLVLALANLFPHRNVGLELACVLMIFTGQVWNMTFSFYQSLRSIPQELRDAARVCRLTWWQRFAQLELPGAAPGLVWNSMMSMAGGWFFLTVTEAFVLGDKDFRLPGIGSYMSAAIHKGDVPAMCYGVIAMVVMIVAVDQLVWRPVVAWSQKFRLEDVEVSQQTTSTVLAFLQRSRVLTWLHTRVWMPLVALGEPRVVTAKSGGRFGAMLWKAVGWALMLALAAAVVWGAVRVVHLLTTLCVADWLRVGGLTGLTFVRVFAAAVIGTLWAVPVGVAIGFSPRLARMAQPVIQVMASFPAPMLYPLVLLALGWAGVGINTGSVVLILLGTQWYILFNVIAGATAIPQELREAAVVYRMGRAERWRRLILPGVFPALVTGWVTAVGGAWNASIVAEYVHFGHKVLTADGLGATISLATDRGDFAMLAASVLAMCVAVVGFNRLVWQRLYRVAEERFSLSK
ncbi:MAG: ABC transporter permease subunit [Verrucomicrobia bacterium]|nr:ABC transporter permease subunit [Verrucomicrobiota bacterium]